jgi:hypothetical protein
MAWTEDNTGSLGGIEAECFKIAQEFMRARKKFAPMRGPHEGYAVILEEMDEMWDAIKTNDVTHARKECLQVAAMALAFLLEVKG